MRRIEFITVAGVVLAIVGGSIIVHESNNNRILQQRSANAIESSVIWTAQPKDTELPDTSAEPIEVLTTEQKVKKVKAYKNVMSIPSLDIKAYIYDNTDRDSLAYGVGWYPSTVKLGEYGNCAVAGHSSAIYNCLLNGIDRIGVLDKVLIYDGEGKKHNYYVINKYIVEPTDIGVLETRDTAVKQFTIITCADNGTHRLVVETIELDDDELASFKKQYFLDRYNDVKSTMASLADIGVSDFLALRSMISDKDYSISSGHSQDVINILRGYTDYDISENQGGFGGGEAVGNREKVDKVRIELGFGDVDNWSSIKPDNA